MKERVSEILKLSEKIKSSLSMSIDPDSGKAVFFVDKSSMLLFKNLNTTFHSQKESFLILANKNQSTMTTVTTIMKIVKIMNFPFSF